MIGIPREEVEFNHGPPSRIFEKEGSSEANAFYHLKSFTEIKEVRAFFKNNQVCQLEYFSHDAERSAAILQPVLSTLAKPSDWRRDPGIPLWFCKKRDLVAVEAFTEQKIAVIRVSTFSHFVKQHINHLL